LDLSIVFKGILFQTAKTGCRQPDDQKGFVGGSYIRSAPMLEPALANIPPKSGDPAELNRQKCRDSLHIFCPHRDKDYQHIVFYGVNDFGIKFANDMAHCYQTST
jgi:hypothetical protein